MPIRKSSMSGVPFGGTSDRPTNPSKGQTFYNGDLAATEVYTGTQWVVMGAIPQQPTIGTSQVTSNRAYNSAAVDVYFTPASSGGLATSYTVTSSPGAITSSGASSPITISGINNKTAYTFTVVASSAYGNSIASSSSNSVTTFTVPDAPVIGTATKGNQSASVTFTSPDNGGSAITNYKYSIDNGATYVALSPAQTSSPLTISGLTNNQTYTVRLKAVNVNGDSATSAASNSVTPDNYPNTIEMLVVAGGGGGGYNLGGGGGAGGLIYNSSLSVSASTTYSVVVGGGGAGSSSGAGSAGNNSVFGSNTAIGGGFGATRNNNAGSGGSGGGSATSTVATGTSGQGNNGGTISNFVAGGGGGAGGAGSNSGSGYAGANGGPGLQYSISGSALFYAGGGGSGATSANGTSFGTIGSGGSGVGGNGSYYSPSITGSTSGMTNRGGGGGAGRDSSSGAAGGSGVVIVRYPNSFNDASISTGSSFVDTGGYKIYTFTGNGSFRF